MSEAAQMNTASDEVQNRFRIVRMSDLPTLPLSKPVDIVGGRLYGAFHRANGDVVLFNRGYAPMFRWDAAERRVHVYSQGYTATITDIARTENFWNDFDPYPGKFFAQVLGDWIMATGVNRPVRCPRIPRAKYVTEGPAIPQAPPPPQT